MCCRSKGCISVILGTYTIMVLTLNLSTWENEDQWRLRIKRQFFNTIATASLMTQQTNLIKINAVGITQSRCSGSNWNTTKMQKTQQCSSWIVCPFNFKLIKVLVFLFNVLFTYTWCESYLTGSCHPRTWKGRRLRRQSTNRKIPRKPRPEEPPLQHIIFC